VPIGAQCRAAAAAAAVGGADHGPPQHAGKVQLMPETARQQIMAVICVFLLCIQANVLKASKHMSLQWLMRLS
jgi:hypothetical protein